MELRYIPQTEEYRQFSIEDLSNGCNSGVYEEVPSSYVEICKSRGLMDLFFHLHLSGRGSEGSIFHQLSPPDHALAEGIDTDGDPQVIRAGTPEVRSSDVVGRSRWIPVLLPAPYHSVLLSVHIQRTLISFYHPSVRFGPLMPLVCKTSPISCSIHTEQFGKYSAVVHRQISGLPGAAWAILDSVGFLTPPKYYGAPAPSARCGKTH